MWTRHPSRSEGDGLRAQVREHGQGARGRLPDWDEIRAFADEIADTVH